MKKASIALCLALVLVLSLIPGVSGESISLSPQTWEGTAGEVAELAIMIDRVPEGLSGYNVTVTVEDPQVAEIANVSYPAWAAFSYIYPPPPASYVHMTVSDLTDGIRPGDTYKELGYLSIRGLNQGKTAIKIKVNKLDTESGSAIKPTITGATITVTSGSVPAGTGGGGGGTGIFGSSITLTSTTAPTASQASVEAADTSTPTSLPTTIADEQATVQTTATAGAGAVSQPATAAESGTGEGDFPWIIIAGAIVAVVLAGLAAIGYNRSREEP